MKILIFGNGFIAHKFHQFFVGSVLCPTKIYGFENIDHEIHVHSPTVVINCIGKTGKPNIDWCESHPQDTFFTNVVVPFMIQDSCASAGVKMVHIGTGCIYDGYRDFTAFTEDKPANFTSSLYSRTKYLAECGLKEFDVLQLRIRMPIDGDPHPRNLLNKLLSYPKTINVLNSITVIQDLMRATEHLISVNATGIFNVVNPEPVGHSDILRIYNEYAEFHRIIQEISTEELNSLTVAPRSNCILSTDKLQNTGFKMTDTITALHKCIKRYVDASGR